MDDKITLAAIGIICLTVIEAMALYCGLNGQVFGSVVAAIAGIIGVVFGIRIQQKRGVDNSNSS